MRLEALRPEANKMFSKKRGCARDDMSRPCALRLMRHGTANTYYLRGCGNERKELEEE